MSPNTQLNWQQKTITDNHSLLAAEIDDNQMQFIHQAVLQTVDKAVELLSNNIEDDSRYFLAEWHPTSATLKIIITDDSKTNDCATTTQLSISAFKTTETLAQQELSEEIQHWIQNYLTTHTGFMQFSLVAVFTDSDRKKCQLL